MPRLRLTDTVDASAPARPFDVRALKTALQQVGDYAPPGGAITAWSDAPMFDELKRFQRRTGLTADGIVSPGGPTETALNAALAERAQPGSRHHSVFRLGDGVGADQPNRGADVRNTKRALAWAGYYPQERAQDPEPSVDDALGFGLLGFQHDFGLTADSYLRPGGETERKLNRLIAPLIAQSGVRASPVADATGRKSPPPPVVNKEADRIRSILDDTPARFEFRPIPKADGSPTFWERPELGRQAVEKFGAIIDKMSAKHGVDPDMLRAIMWFENARGHWLGGNDLKDWLGTSGSVMPMNIKPELWGPLVGNDAGRLEDPEQNIEAATILIKRITERLDDPIPEAIGSIWNYTGREQPNERGAAIARIYREKPWAKKSRIDAATCGGLHGRST